eukprot:1878627-Alexandrium_andersonii.AAC.1
MATPTWPCKLKACTSLNNARGIESTFLDRHNVSDPSKSFLNLLAPGAASSDASPVINPSGNGGERGDISASSSGGQ